MKIIQRTTDVISISLPKNVSQKLDRISKDKGQSKSSLITSLIDQFAENNRWQRIYKRGEETGRKFKITSEDDIDRILHGR